MKETYPHPLPNLPLERGGTQALLSSSGEEDNDCPPLQGEEGHNDCPPLQGEG